MIKLIALDLDGTLVNESLEISARTLDVLRRVEAEKGVKVVLATGRMFPSAIPFARTLGVTSPLIAYQGAMIRDIRESLADVLSHPILFHRPIELEITRKIIDIVQEQDLHANIYINDRLYTTRFNPNSTYYQKISGVVPQQADDLLAILTEAPSKIMIIDDACDRLVSHLREAFPATLSICKSRYNFCEIVDASVSKWQAIQHLMQEWDIRPEEVMAIGDQENDLSMLEGAGIGVAMGNAPDNVKERANYVTESIDHDGAARAIEKFVYGHLPLQDPEAVGS